MDTQERDAQAWNLYAAGRTWAQVAIDLHYANGSVARRAAMRHNARLGSTPPVDPQPEPAPIADQQPTVEPTPPQTDRPDWPADTLLYRVGEPKATYRMVGWNKDGSAQVWGGLPNQPAYHDYRPEDLSTTPVDPIKAITRWAETHLFAEVTVGGLASEFAATPRAVGVLIGSRPDLFRRIGHGVYEVRDPKADREADRAMREAV